MAAAESGCEIEEDTLTVIELRERTIPLAQYGEVFIRSGEGAIRCNADDENSRYICLIDGPGVIYVEGGDQPPKGMIFATDEIGEAHIYRTADLSCGLKSEFDKYR